MISQSGLKQQVKIGALDRQITVRSEATSTTNSLAEVTAVTNTDVTVWANVSNEDKTTGLEQDLNDKQTVVENLVFVIRYRTLLFTQKIVYSSSTYDITGIEELGRRAYLKVRTKRIV